MRKLAPTLAIVALLLCACGEAGPTASPQTSVAARTEATAVPTATPIPATDTPTPVPSPTASPIPATETATAEPSPSPTEPPVKVIQNVAYVPDGRIEQKLDLYLPTRGEGPFPVLLMIHQGGGRKEQLSFWGRTFGEQGYAAVSINHRQWPDDGYPSNVQDAFCALAWIHTNAAQYGFDPQNVFALGHSAGATLAAMLGVVDDPDLYLEDCPHSLPESDWVRGVIPFAGVFDYARAVRGAPRLDDYAVELLGGGLEEKPGTWAEASPASWVDGSEPPFLIIHGAEDIDIPPGNSQEFYNLLAAAGVDADLIMIHGTNHAEITKNPECLEAVGAFLARLLE